MDCGKKINRFFSDCNMYDGSLVCGKCDDRKRAKKKKDVLVFRPKYFRWYFSVLTPLVLLSVLYILSFQQQLDGMWQLEWGEKIQVFIFLVSIFAIGLLVLSSWIIEHWGIEICESERYVEGPSGKLRVKIPFDKINWKVTMKRSALQRLLGYEYIRSKYGGRIRINKLLLGQEQVKLIYSKLSQIESRGTKRVIETSEVEENPETVVKDKIEGHAIKTSFEVGKGLEYKIDILHSFLGLETYKVNGEEVLKTRSLYLRGNIKFTVGSGTDRYNIEIKYDVVPTWHSWFYPVDWIAMAYVNGALYIEDLTPHIRTAARRLFKLMYCLLGGTLLLLCLVTLFLRM